MDTIDFNIKIINNSRNILKNKEKKVCIFGNSFHLTKKELHDKYLNNSIEDFLSFEAANSIGNYLIFDKINYNIITSIGYCGGYIYQNKNIIQCSTLLSNILKNIGYNNLEINKNRLIRFLEKPIQEMLPISTIFENIERILPAMVIHISNENIYRYVYPFKYINNTYNEINFSFSSALDKVIKLITKNGCINNYEIMFSGGIDSSALALSFLKSTSYNKINFTNFDYGNRSTNTPERGRIVSQLLNIQTNKVDFLKKHENNTFLIKTIEYEMENDFVNLLNPHRGYTKIINKDSLIISGQNFDAMSIINMKRYQSSFFRRILLLFKQNIRIKEKIKFIIKILHDIKHNYQFVDKKLNKKNKIYRQNNSRSTNKYNIEGIILGMISTGKPFLVNKKYHYIENRELNKILKLNKSKSKRNTLDLIHYINYQSNTNKQIATFKNYNGIEVVLPAMTGPIMNYYIHKSRTIQDAINPKREIYKYFRRESGYNYNLLFDKLQDIKFKEKPSKKVIFKLLVKNKDKFNYKHSYLISLINDKETQEYLKLKYSDAYNLSDKKMTYDNPTVNFANKILNIELLLRNIDKTQ